MLRQHLGAAVVATVQLVTSFTVLSCLPIDTAFAAEPDGAQATYRFEIQAGTLVQALTSFAEVTKANVAYGPELVRGLRSSGVSGQRTAEEALRQLLKAPAATSNSPTRGQVKIPHLTAAGAVGVYAV